MTKLRIVGFAGPKYCGKDTAAKQLLELNETGEKYYFHRLPMAGGAKACAATAFDLTEEELEDPVLKEKPLDRWPYICPRQLVIDVANWYRDKYTGHIWANRWERLARAPYHEGIGCFLITDMRFPEELEMLKRNKGLLVYVNRPQAEEDLARKQAEGDEMARNVSESHYAMLREAADVEVNNDGTLAHLRGQVLSVVRDRYDYWGYWPNIEKRIDVLHELRTGGMA